MQNLVARVATGESKKKCDYIILILTQLHWLPVAGPVARQLEVRYALMTFKCLNGLAQAYLRSKFIVRADDHSLNTRHRNKLDECTAIQNSYRPAVICIHTEPLGFGMNYIGL